MKEQLVQLYGYLHGMWRYRWSALVISWIVALVGWAYVLTLPDHFNSKAVLYVDTSSVMQPLLKGLAPETDANDELVVMNRYLLSRENLMSVIRETDMDLEAQTPKERELLVEALAESIEIKGDINPNKKNSRSNVFEISYFNERADRSYQVVSHLLNTMIEDTLSSTRTDTVTAKKFLDEQIAEYESRLSLAEQQLAEFKKVNVGFMPDEKGGYYMRLQRAQDSVETTRSRFSLAQRRYAELSRQLHGERPVINSQGFQSLKNIKLKRYQDELDSLLNQFTDKHPDVVALKATIEEFRANSNADLAGNLTSSGFESNDLTEFNPVYQQIKSDLSQASVEVVTLKIQLVDQKQYVIKLKSSIDFIPEVEAKLSKLNRDYEVTRERYVSLVERRESALLAQRAGQSTSDVTFRIIESPIVPLKPSGPPRMLFMLTAFVAALLAGLSWSFIRYVFQPTFIDLNQVADVTGLPVLGAVSLYLSDEHKSKRRYQLVSFLVGVALIGVVFGGSVIFMENGRHFLTSIL